MICVLEIYGFLRFASRLANPFGHLSQVCTQVLVLQACVDLRRLASSFGQGLIIDKVLYYNGCITTGKH